MTHNDPVTIYADLHTHTTCSDGLLSPIELITKAEQVGLRALSITDHDTMAAHAELKRGGYNGSVTIIPGIEISCFEAGRDIHVLGYHLDSHNTDVKAYIEFFKHDRDRRAMEMIDRLRRMGCAISYEEVVERAAGAPIGRPHVASVLIARGYASSIQNAFDKWLDRSKPGYVAKAPYSVRQAVDMVRAAGGVAVIAHPGKTYNDPRLFLGLISSGIDGIEVFHSSHWSVTREYYRVLAKQHALIMTGGSDYHGSRDYDDRNFGNIGVPIELYDALAARVELRRSQYLQAQA
jgi:3',5'-nucleoside bisphosphate phosphatase